MKVLIVEDDEYKSDELSSLLEAVCRNVDVHLMQSVSTAIRCVNERSFDLVILDMALPSHTATPGGGAPKSLLTGGIEVLFELQALNKNYPCIIVTQYPEIEICGDFYSLYHASAAIEKNYGVRVLGCVEYANMSKQWRVHLEAILEEICEF